MPYNTTAIPPRKEVTGSTLLPLTRVKKIIAQDPDIQICSNNAAFIITLATEMFVQHLATEAQNMAKLERKPRRNIQYKDLANAVQHQDNLEFLEDLVPKTTTLRQVKDQAAAMRARLCGNAKDGTAASIAAAKAAACAATAGKSRATTAMSPGSGGGDGSEGVGAGRNSSSVLISDEDNREAAGGAEERAAVAAKGKKHSKAGRIVSTPTAKPAAASGQGTLASYGFQSINAPTRQAAPREQGGEDVDMTG